MTFYIARFKDIDEKKYKLEVVTPMFLGGANSNKAELRAPSFKGMLRFWWRAISDIDDIEELYRKESEIFGNSEKKSKISLKLKFSEINISKDLFNGKIIIVKSSKRDFKIDILRYLSFGTFKYGKEKDNKEYICVGNKFDLSIRAPKDTISEADDALKYLLTFGGVGAKNRNGFGSMYCKDIQYLTDFKKTGDLKKYTSFSAKAKLIKFSKYDKWEDALSEIGLAYRAIKVSLRNKHNFEGPALIAKQNIIKNKQNIPKDAKGSRHPKPYFLHVNKLPGGLYQGQILFLPYRFNTSSENEDLKKYIDACHNEMKQIIQQKAGGE